VRHVDLDARLVSVPPRRIERPYQVVAGELRQRIEAGEWQSGEALPANAELARSYGVAQATVARALRELADEGLVTIIPRWGVFRT
jgi:DNA-binding GntR family transcriptional regulator